MCEYPLVKFDDTSPEFDCHTISIFTWPIDRFGKKVGEKESR